MDTETLRDVPQIFLKACKLPTAARTAYLDRACANASVRSRVEAMLRADESVHTFLDGSALDILPGIADDATLVDEVPHSIGPYRIADQLAQGGMGTVYLGLHPKTDRIVAIKVIRRGLATAQMMHRFAYEARLLARLHHPGIAQIFEASTHDSGHGPQPYLAMEFVEGLPLLDFVADAKLRTKRRLELLLRLCDAVQHAHQKGVIHRDLKPSNIIVTGNAQPKILDFGVARDIDVGVVGAQTLVDVHQVAGTVPYMAPEQISGAGDDIDTRCDVYALGVIGYQILSGQLPYPLDDTSIAEAARIIHEEEPKKLSAYKRHFSGDIENIFGKALSKDKEDRYPTAQSLGNDIRRFLSDEPITAQQPPPMTRARKFIRRHKAFVGGAAATLVVFALGVLGMWWEGEKADRMSEEATRRHNAASLAQARVDVQAEQLARREIKLMEAEERADLDAEAAADARAQAEANLEVAKTYHEKVGASFQQAEAAIAVVFRNDERLELADTLASEVPDAPDLVPTVRAMWHDALGGAFGRAGSVRRADTQFAAALEILDAEYAEWEARNASTIAEVQGDSPEEPSLEALRPLLDGDDPWLGRHGRVLLRQAVHFLGTGRPEAAIASATASIEKFTREHGPLRPPQTAPLLVRALAQLDLEQFAEAQSDILRIEALEQSDEVSPAVERATLAHIQAVIALHDGDPELARERHDLATKLLPDRNLGTGLARRHGAFELDLLLAQGDLFNYANSLGRLYETRLTETGPTSPQALKLGVQLADALRLAERPLEAYDVLARMVDNVSSAQRNGEFLPIDAGWTAARRVDIAELLLERAIPEDVGEASMETSLALAELNVLADAKPEVVARAHMMHGRALVAEGFPLDAPQHLARAFDKSLDAPLDLERRRLALECLYGLHVGSQRWSEAQEAAEELAHVVTRQADDLRRASAQIKLADVLHARELFADERRALELAADLREQVYNSRDHSEVVEITERLEELRAETEPVATAGDQGNG